MKDKKLTTLFVYHTEHIKYYYNIAYFFRMFGFLVEKYKLDSYSSDLEEKMEDYSSVIFLDIPQTLKYAVLDEAHCDNISQKMLEELVAKGVIEPKNASIFTACCKSILQEHSSKESKMIPVNEKVKNQENYCDVVQKNIIAFCETKIN